MLSPEESAHAARVLRLRPGEEIVLLDGQTLWSAKLEVVNDRACEARVLSPRSSVAYRAGGSQAERPRARAAN